MKYIKRVLKNGMTIVFMPMNNTQAIAMGFFVKAGSRNEPPGKAGIAHFLEHMMFKGTNTRDTHQIFNQLDSLGTLYNAATTAQTTYYYIYGNSEDSKQILDIILDIYINPDFSEKEISKERKIIIEEMRTRQDAPLAKLYSVMHRKIFAGTTLSHDVIGVLDTINNITREDIIKFRESLYTPKNTVFVVAGNFNPVAIYKLILPALKNLKNTDLSIINYANEKETIYKNMEQQSEPYVYLKKINNFNQAYVLLAFPIFDLYKTRYHEIDLLTIILTSGLSSRLNQKLREEAGIVYSSTAYPIIYKDAGVYIIQIIVNPRELVNAVNILMELLHELKINPINHNELEKIVGITKNETIYSLTDPLKILTYVGLNVLTNREFRPNLKKEILDIKKINSEKIMDIAKKIFIHNKLNMYIYGDVDTTAFDFTLL